MSIRTVSLCIIRRKNELLLEESYDEVTNTTFYRPVGGTVELGENSKLTVIREVKEEINAEITEPRLLGVIENIFTYQDQTGHEIDFVYEAEFLDPGLYNEDEVPGIEGTKTYRAVWKSLESFNDVMNIKLVPDGLSELLADNKMNRNIRHVKTM